MLSSPLRTILVSFISVSSVYIVYVMYKRNKENDRKVFKEGCLESTKEINEGIWSELNHSFVTFFLTKK